MGKPSLPPSLPPPLPPSFPPVHYSPLPPSVPPSLPPSSPWAVSLPSCCSVSPSFQATTTSTSSVSFAASWEGRQRETCILSPRRGRGGREGGRKGRREGREEIVQYQIFVSPAIHFSHALAYRSPLPSSVLSPRFLSLPPTPSTPMHVLIPDRNTRSHPPFLPPSLPPSLPPPGSSSPSLPPLPRPCTSSSPTGTHVPWTCWEGCCSSTRGID